MQNKILHLLRCGNRYTTDVEIGPPSPQNVVKPEIFRLNRWNKAW